jgi:ankyrin repeat protein
MTLLTLQAQKLHDAVRRKNMISVTKLLDADPSLLNATNYKGETLLHRMVLLDAPENVSLLLARGIDMNLQDRFGYTALWIALNEVKPDKNPNVQEIIRLLVQNGACVCCPSPDGEIPICTIIERRQVDLVRLALARYPQLVNPPQQSGEAHECGLSSYYSPVQKHPSSRFDPRVWQTRPLLEYAIGVRATEIVKVLLEAGANPNPVPYGSFLYMDTRSEIIQLLIDAGAIVPNPEEIGATALHIAALRGRSEELIRALLKAEFYVDARAGDGCTPLHDAVFPRDLEPIKMLVAAGADINAASNAGITPLMFAARMQWKEGVAFLLGEGASVGPKDEDGNTALHHAAIEDYGNKVMALLVEAGGDAGQGNDLGITPTVFYDARWKQDRINHPIGGRMVERTRYQCKELLGYVVAANRQGMGKDAYWTLSWTDLRSWHKNLRYAELTKKQKP